MRGQNSQEIAPAPVRYSSRQIALHWIVFVLVAFQFVMGDDMTDLFAPPTADVRPTRAPIWAPIHIAVGTLILIAMLARLCAAPTRRRPEAAEAGHTTPMARDRRACRAIRRLDRRAHRRRDRLFPSALVRRAAPSHDAPNPCRPGRAPFRRGALALACRSR